MSGGGGPLRSLIVPAELAGDGVEVGHVVLHGDLRRADEGQQLLPPAPPRARGDQIILSAHNASLNVVRAVADRIGPVDVAILFAGAAQTALVPDGYLTLTSEGAARAAEILEARVVVPVHFEGWTHFTQGRDTLLTAFERAELADRLHLLEPGEATDL